MRIVSKLINKIHYRTPILRRLVTDFFYTSSGGGSGKVLDPK